MENATGTRQKALALNLAAKTLFAGLPVTPYVYDKEPSHGPYAGRRVQDFARPVAPTGAHP